MGESCVDIDECVLLKGEGCSTLRLEIGKGWD